MKIADVTRAAKLAEAKNALDIIAAEMGKMTEEDLGKARVSIYVFNQFGGIIDTVNLDAHSGVDVLERVEDVVDGNLVDLGVETEGQQPDCQCPSCVATSILFAMGDDLLSEPLGRSETRMTRDQAWAKICEAIDAAALHLRAA